MHECVGASDVCMHTRTHTCACRCERCVRGARAKKAKCRWSDVADVQLMHLHIT